MAKNTQAATAARRHKSLPTTIGGYENLLIEMIEKRTGAEFDVFLTPQVTTCAQCWMMLSKVHKSLMKEKSLVCTGTGSKGQQKEDANPLLPYYLKLQAELRLQFQSLGLNWNATPSKIIENTKKGVDDSDPMAQFYSNAMKQP